MKCSLREWQQIIKQPDDLIIAASNTNGEDTWTEHSIGMSAEIIYFLNRPDKFQIGNHLKTVTCSFSPNTDSYRRPYSPNREAFLKTLSLNGIYNRNCPPREYFYSLPSYKFIVSPEGNGIDCHRHYEALIAGTIPIIEENLLIQEKYKNMPVLFTKDYTEINAEYLENKYNQMIDVEYDFSQLFKSSWSESVQQLIKKNSDYWIYKNTKKSLPWNASV
jgi:hypothetical protein